MGALINLVGQRFGRLLVKVRSYTGNPRIAFWECVCDCGNSTTVRSADLRNGHTSSCGCAQNAPKHGHSPVGYKSPTYSSWANMMQRCYNSRHRSYPRYGSRGIRVCERWKSFENFYADMGARPRGKTLDRIKNHLGYNRENCRWATRSEQELNKG